MVADPSFVLSTSASLASAFAIKNEESYSCEGGRHTLTIDLTTDNDSKLESSVLIASLQVSA